MSIEEFISYWTGKPIDFDGSYPNQCVDLAKYWQQNLGLTPTKGNAIDFKKNYNPNDYTWIDNTESNIPEKGDLIIWGTGIGQYGHVAIFVSGDNLEFDSFDANYPLKTLPHIQNHTYRNVIGWLRSRKEQMGFDDNYMKNLITELYGFENEQIKGDKVDQTQNVNETMIEVKKGNYIKVTDMIRKWWNEQDKWVSAIDHEAKIKSLEETNEGYVELLSDDHQKMELMELDIKNFKKQINSDKQFTLQSATWGDIWKEVIDRIFGRGSEKE